MKFSILRLAFFIAYRRVAGLTSAIPEIWDECVQDAAAWMAAMDSESIVPWVD